MKYALILLLVLSGCSGRRIAHSDTQWRIDNPLVETIKALKGNSGGPVRYSSQTDENMKGWR